MEYVKLADFVSRTQEIVNDYDGDYEVTMLLNACVGLLFICNEKSELQEHIKTTILHYPSLA